jgi:hypothetical protein
MSSIIFTKKNIEEACGRRVEGNIDCSQYDYSDFTHKEKQIMPDISNKDLLNISYPIISEDEVNKYNRVYHSIDIDKKIKLAQKNFKSYLAENIDKNLDEINSQLELVDSSLRSKRELELTNTLYFGLPVSQISTSLSLVSAAYAGFSLFLVPIVALCFSLTYTYNNIKREGLSSTTNKILISLSLVATAVTAIAIASAVGATLPISGPMIIGLATMVNFALFIYSFKLENDRNKGAEENMMNNIFEISDMILNLNKDDEKYNEKHTTLIRSAQIYLLGYSDTVRTVKDPFAKRKHIRNISRIRESFIRSELSSHGEFVSEKKSNNIFDIENAILNSDVPIQYKEINELLKLNPLSDTVTLNNKQIDIRSIKHEINMLKVLNNKQLPELFADKISINETALKNGIILKYINDNKKDDKVAKFLSELASNKVVDFASYIHTSHLDDKIADIEKEIDPSKIADIKNSIKDNNLFQDIESAERHVAAYAIRDAIYYGINLAVCLIGFAQALEPLIGLAIFASPPTAIAVTALIGVFVLSSACLYVKQKYFDKDTKLQEKYDSKIQNMRQRLSTQELGINNNISNRKINYIDNTQKESPSNNNEQNNTKTKMTT